MPTTSSMVKAGKKSEYHVRYSLFSTSVAHKLRLSWVLTSRSLSVEPFKLCQHLE
jgi:hypothetical protein